MTTTETEKLSERLAGMWVWDEIQYTCGCVDCIIGDNVFIECENGMLIVSHLLSGLRFFKERKEMIDYINAVEPYDDGDDEIDLELMKELPQKRPTSL